MVSVGLVKSQRLGLGWNIKKALGYNQRMSRKKMAVMICNNMMGTEWCVCEINMNLMTWQWMLCVSTALLKGLVDLWSRKLTNFDRWLIVEVVYQAECQRLADFLICLDKTNNLNMSSWALGTWASGWDWKIIIDLRNSRNKQSYHTVYLVAVPELLTVSHNLTLSETG